MVSRDHLNSPTAARFLQNCAILPAIADDVNWRLDATSDFSPGLMRWHDGVLPVDPILFSKAGDRAVSRIAFCEFRSASANLAGGHRSTWKGLHSTRQELHVGIEKRGDRAEKALQSDPAGRQSSVGSVDGAEQSSARAYQALAECQGRANPHPVAQREDRAVTHAMAEPEIFAD